MKAWRIQVFKQNGQLLSWKEAYIRSWLSLGGIGTLWGLFDKEKRGLQDLVFNARVIELPKDFYKTVTKNNND